MSGQTETNGKIEHIELVFQPQDDPRSFYVQAMWRGKLMHGDLMNTSQAWHRQRFVSDLKEKARRIPEWREFEKDQDFGLPYSPHTERGDDDANLFTWIDQAILERSQPAEAESPIVPVSIGTLIADYPRLADPIIDRLLRRGETANVIAPPKFGKSWLAYSLTFAVIMGAEWLGRFLCLPGKVLLIDNELHPATIAHRIAYVAKMLGLQPIDYQQDIDVLSLRGRLMDLHAIARAVERLESGAYHLVILDAWYRALPEGVSENDNAAVMQLYNVIDHTAEKLNTAWLNIHHATKGSQTDKSITDMGAGAGSQSRAADAHIVLRPHEEQGVVVIEAVVRSFPPVEPLPLRFEYPLWLPATDVDPALLKGRLSRQEEKKSRQDKEGIDTIVDALRKAGGKLTTAKLRKHTGIGLHRLERLLGGLVRDEQVSCEDIRISGHDSSMYTLLDGGSV